MKRSILLACFLMWCVTTSAVAADANSCVAESAMLPPPQRNAFMQGCLARLSAPSHVQEVEQQNKKALCEQNARNHKLQGNELTDYVASCMAGATQPETRVHPAGEQRAGVLNLGISFSGTSDLERSTGIGMGFQGGYEKNASDGWHKGVQLHVIDASNGGTSLQSTALYATARPENKWLHWLQLKAGIAHANYSYLYNTNISQQRKEWGGTGTALGVGIILGDENLQLHLLDIDHYELAGHGFNTYSITVLVIVGLGKLAN